MKINQSFIYPSEIRDDYIPQQFGCELMEHNYLKIDAFQKTTEYGIFACGDNSSMMRAVFYAVAMGGFAGAMTNRELTEEEFK